MKKHVVLNTLSAIAAAAAFSCHGAVTLYDFEEDGKTHKINARTFYVGVTNAFATSGTHGLRFRCDDWKQGMPEWPSFTLAVPVRDWTKFDRLSIDIVSLGDAEAVERLSIFIAGPDGRIQNGLSSGIGPVTRGYSQCVVQLAGRWPKTAPADNVARFHMFVSRPKSVDLVIDRVTLLEKGEPPPAPSGLCVGRDILPLMARATAEIVARNAELQGGVDHLRDYARFCFLSGTSRYRSSAMALGTATSMEKICPRACFSAKAIPDGGLALRLARNEYESLQLLVAPLGADLKDVRIAIVPLRGPGGAVFDATNIVCGVTGYVKTLKRPPYKVGRDGKAPETGWWPDPILDYLGAVDVKGEDVQSFWVRARCPAGQPAGMYRGKIKVEAAGVEPVEIPLTVRVNDFEVPRASPLPMAITFGPGPSRQLATPEEMALCNSLVKDPLAPVNMWKKHVAEWGDFLADYYITMDSLYHRGAIHFDVLERLKRQGRLGVFNLGYWSYPKSTNDADMAAWRGSTVPRLRRAYDEAKARGLLDHAYCYGCDEVPESHFDAMRLAVGELKRALPGVPISTTAYDHEFGVKTPLGVMDWFTPLTPKFDPAKAAASRGEGHKVWWYICCGPKAPHANMFIECPAIEGRMLMGAQTVRMRPDGFLYYQITLWNSRRCIEGGPFTDWTARSWTTFHGDGSWTCCGPDGRPLPTVRLENFRDGLEDYAYALELERRLAARRADDEWSKEAKRLLAVPCEVMDSMTSYTYDPDVLYRWRDAMADLIESSGK